MCLNILIIPCTAVASGTAVTETDNIEKPLTMNGASMLETTEDTPLDFDMIDFDMLHTEGFDFSLLSPLPFGNFRNHDASTHDGRQRTRLSATGSYDGYERNPPSHHRPESRLPAHGESTNNYRYNPAQVLNRPTPFANKARSESFSYTSSRTRIQDTLGGIFDSRGCGDYRSARLGVSLVPTEDPHRATSLQDAHRWSGTQVRARICRVCRYLGSAYVHN
jgi:hypothetical protein